MFGSRRFKLREVDGKTMAICTLCEGAFKYNTGGTTPNLLSHLKNKHGQGIVSKSVAASGSNQPKITSFASAAPTRTCTEPRQKEITNLLARGTWINPRPLSIVTDEGLRDLLAYVEPQYKPPSHTHVAHLVWRRHRDGVAKLTKLLEMVDGLALTTDAWTSRATESYTTTTGHFIDAEWRMHSCVLEACHFPGSHTAVRLAKKLSDTVDRFKFPSTNCKVCTVVHDQAASVELAGSILLDDMNWASFTCGAHRLQNAIKTALSNCAGSILNELLTDCRKIVTHFRKSSLAGEALKQEQKAKG